MSGVFQNIDLPPHRPASVCPPPLVRGEDTLAGWRGGWGVNILEDADTALYSTYVSTLWQRLSGRVRDNYFDAATYRCSVRRKRHFT
jgi:hypothetical protein